MGEAEVRNEKKRARCNSRGPGFQEKTLERLRQSLERNLEVYRMVGAE